MCFGYVIGPSFNPVGLDFHGFAALPADQVMVVAGATGSVEKFAVFALQAVGLAVFGQGDPCRLCRPCAGPAGPHARGDGRRDG